MYMCVVCVSFCVMLLDAKAPLRVSTAVHALSTYI